MKKSCLSFALIAFLFAGCSTYKIMPGQFPDEIVKDPNSAVLPPAIPSLKGKTVVLELVADYTTQPIGGYFDDELDNITNVNSTYVIPKAGYVLFAKMSENLANAEAKVFRKYPGPSTKSVKMPSDTRYVSIVVKNIEFHVQKNVAKELSYIASAVIMYGVGDSIGKDVPMETVKVSAVVKQKDDPFLVIANRFLNGVVPKL